MSHCLLHANKARVFSRPQNRNTLYIVSPQLFEYSIHLNRKRKILFILVTINDVRVIFIPLDLRLHTVVSLFLKYKIAPNLYSLVL